MLTNFHLPPISTHVAQDEFFKKHPKQEKYFWKFIKRYHYPLTVKSAKMYRKVVIQFHLSMLGFEPLKAEEVLQ